MTLAEVIKSVREGYIIGTIEAHQLVDEIDRLTAARSQPDLFDAPESEEPHNV
jgi:hypothetical protein